MIMIDNDNNDNNDDNEDNDNNDETLSRCKTAHLVIL